MEEKSSRSFLVYSRDLHADPGTSGCFPESKDNWYSSLFYILFLFYFCLSVFKFSESKKWLVFLPFCIDQKGEIIPSASSSGRLLSQRICAVPGTGTGNSWGRTRNLFILLWILISSAKQYRKQFRKYCRKKAAFCAGWCPGLHGF